MSLRPVGYLRNCLIKGLYRLLEEDRYTDVTLLKGDKSYKIHQIVLHAYLSELKINEDGILLIENPKVDLDFLIHQLYEWKDITLAQFQKILHPTAIALKVNFITQTKIKRNLSSSELNLILKEKWLNTFFTFLHQCYISKVHADINIKVENDEFHCHKVILAAVSPVFDAMFLSGMRETDSKEIILHGVQTTAFRDILDYIYLGKRVINTKNIEKLLNTAVYLQMQCVQERCEKYLIRNLDIDNALGVLRLADMLSIGNIRRKSIKFIVQNFHEFVKTRDFPGISIEHLEEIVKDENLLVKNETDVLNVVISLFKTSSITEKCLVLVLNHLELGDVSLSMLSAAENVCQNVQASSMVKTILANAIKVKSDACEEEVTCSSSSRKEEVLLVVRATGYSPGINVTCYSFFRKLWFSLSSLSHYNPGCAFGVCSLNSQIFVSGGSGSPYTFCCYDTNSDVWLSLPNLPEERSEHVIAAVGDYAFVFGGRTQLYAVQSAVQKFHIRNRSWEHCTDLSPPKFGAAGAVLGKEIILCGGCISFGEYSDLIQSFNTTTYQCTTISRLPLACSFLDITQNDDVLYIVTPRGQVIMYEPEEDLSVLGCVHHSSLMDFSTAYYRGEVLVLGGTSCKSESDEIISFDLQAKKASLYKNLKLPWPKMSNQYFCMTTHIYKKLLSRKYINKC